MRKTFHEGAATRPSTSLRVNKGLPYQLAIRLARVGAAFHLC